MNKCQNCSYNNGIEFTDTIKNLYKMCAECDTDPFDPHLLDKEYTFFYDKNDPEVRSFYEEAMKVFGVISQYNKDIHTGVQVVLRLTPDSKRFYNWIEISLAGTYLRERFNENTLKLSYSKLGINIKKLKYEYLNTYRTVKI